MRKIGRNDKCPCDSGKKYKKCHGMNNGTYETRIPITKEEIQILFKQQEAKKIQKENQQGKGKGIIATKFQGGIAIALGNRVYNFPKAQTFHDVLFNYPSSLFGINWFRQQLSKESNEHPLFVTWYKKAIEQMSANQKGNESINNFPMTGAIRAYLDLSWNLFLIQNDTKIQNILLKRLKNTHGPTFQGVLYETYVASAFIKAGFKIEFENEKDSTTTHGEFFAVHPNGKKYLVEAKAKQPDSNIENFTHSLKKALTKVTQLERIILIELNLPKIDDITSENILKKMHECQSTLTINGSPSPKAYVFFTNHPAQFNLETTPQSFAFFFDGFKIQDFPAYFEHLGGNKYVEAKKRDAPLYDLIDSLITHNEIPSTIDGELPEFAYNLPKNSPTRLIIGNHILVDTSLGEKEAIIEDGFILESKNLAVCTLKLLDNSRIIYNFPLTDIEMNAYKRSPDTFFGVHKEVSRKQAKTPSDFFDFLFHCYHKTPKNKLIEFLTPLFCNHDLESKSQEELAILYCEKMTIIESGNLIQRLKPDKSN